MTKEVTYVCNLCRAKKEPDQLLGIYFITNQTFELRDAMNCNTHICLTCSDLIVHLIQKLKTSLKPKA